MRWSLFRSPFRQEPTAPTRRLRRTSRPSIDQLEDRSVPSAVPLAAQRPVATSDWSDTDGTTPVTVSVLDNDKPAINLLGGPAHALIPNTVRMVTAPKNGTVTINKADGSMTYTAAAGFLGVDTFRYAVKDSAGVSSPGGLVTIRVNGPVANDDWTDTDGTAPVTVPVLDNDSDPDGNSHIRFPGSVAIVSQPAHGTAVVNTDDTVTYTANPGFGGTDSFKYTVTDDNGATSVPAKVLVRVNRPTANDDFATGTGGPVSIDVLGNDTDPDGNGHIQFPGSVTIASEPAHGTVSVDPASDLVTYTPTGGFTGTDRFTYTVTDDAGAASAPATVTIVEQGPVQHDLVQDTDGRNRVTFQVGTVDPKMGVARRIAITSRAHHGQVGTNGTTGKIAYRANAGFGGTDSFDYRLKQSDGTFVTGTITVVVNRPVANDDWTDTDGSTPVTLSVLDNDGDPDGSSHIQQPGSVRIVSQPTHGHVTVNHATNEVTYTGGSSFFTGTDSFKYTVTDDARATSAPALAFVRVNRPTAASDEVELIGTTPTLIDVLANDTDPDGNDHIQQAGSVSLRTKPAHGTVTLNTQSNQFTYTARPGFVGTDTFVYVVTDDAGAISHPATVTVIVDGPVAASGSFQVTNSQATLFLLGSPAPAGSTIQVLRGPSFGTLTVDHSTGKVVYTGGKMFLSDSFVYTVRDASGNVSAPATITLTSPLTPITFLSFIL
jgi:large repetitive protein